MSKRYKLLHIYGPEHEHQEAFVIGNRAGLESLRDAIDKALSEGKAAVEMFAGDGEGYRVGVGLHEGEFEAWTKLALPYSGDWSEDKRQDIIWPIEVIGFDLLYAEWPPPSEEDEETE